MRAHILTVLALSLLLSLGCTSSDDGVSTDTGSTDENNGSVTTDTRDVAVLLFNDDAVRGQVLSQAQFTRVDHADLSTLTDYYRQSAPDSCAFRDATDFLWLDSDNAVNVIETLDAGESLLIGSSAGSYLDVARSGGDGQYVYQAVVDGSYLPAPSGLSWSVSGAEFAPAADVAIPDVQTSVVVTPSTAQSLNATTQFLWQPLDLSNGQVLLQLLDINGVGLYCRVQDDGAFMVPAEAWQSGFNVGNVTQIRVGYLATEISTKGTQTFVNVRAIF